METLTQLIEREALLDGRSREAKALRVQISAALAAEAELGTAEAKVEQDQDFLARANAPEVNVDTPLIEMVGGTKFERFSEPLEQVESFLVHLEINNPEVGRSTDGVTNYTSIIPIDSNSPILKCHYARTEAWSVPDGRVGTLPLDVHWLQRPDSWAVVEYGEKSALVPLNLIHKVLEGYAHTNSAWVSDSPDTSAQGKHTKQFVANASRFFTEDSFYTQEDIDADSDLPNNSIRRVKPRAMSVDNPSADGAKLNEWVLERIVSFNWNPEAFRLEREAKERTARTNTPTMTIACNEHHWKLEHEERDSENTVRAKEGFNAPLCANSEHSALLVDRIMDNCILKFKEFETAADMRAAVATTIESVLLEAFYIVEPKS